MSFALLILCLLNSADAQPAPLVETFSTPVVQRGKSAQLEFRGRFLGSVERIYFSDELGLKLKNLNADTESFSVELEVSGTASLGEREVRLVGKAGVSRPLALTVTELPAAAEAQANNSLENAQAISLPVELGAILGKPREQDFYRFYGKKDEVLVFHVIRERGSELQGTTRLYDATGKAAAWAVAESGLDAHLIYTVQADGDYVFAIRDREYRGGENFGYRVRAGTIPFVRCAFPLGGRPGTTVEIALEGANLGNHESVKIEIPSDVTGRRFARTIETAGTFSNPILLQSRDLPSKNEKEPNDKPATATELSIPCAVSGRIEKPGAADYFQFHPQENGLYSIEVFAQRLHSPLDPLLTLSTPDKPILKQADDSEGQDSSITYDFRSGEEYLITLNDLLGRGGSDFVYRLVIEPANTRADFAVRFGPDSLRIEQGTYRYVELEVERLGGFTGAINISCEGLPAGMKFDPIVVKENSGNVTGRFHAAVAAALGTTPLSITAAADVEGKEVKRSAVSRYGGRNCSQAFITVIKPQPIPLGGVMVQGINYRYYEGRWEKLPRFEELKPLKTGTAKVFDLSPSTRNDDFGLLFDGFIDLPRDGHYSFFTNSDDGSALFIGTRKLVDNDGIHGMAEVRGDIDLKKGKHPIKVSFSQLGGGKGLEVYYSGPGIDKQQIPEKVLYRPVVSMAPGLNYEYYEGNWQKLPNFAALKPVKSGSTGKFDLSSAPRNTQIGLRFSGFIEVPQAGEYSFYVKSDDGTRLYIIEREIVNNDGTHGDEIEVKGSIRLEPGRHRIRLDFFQGGGPLGLWVGYSGPGITKQTIPGKVLYRVAHP